MPTGRSFLFSREFRLLCLYAGLLLICVVALVIVRMHGTLRQKPSKERHSRHKRHGKLDTKER